MLYGTNKLTLDTIRKFAYPMQAVGKVHHGDAEYAPGAIFDAQTISSVNYHKVHKSATVWSEEDAQAPSEGVNTADAEKAEPDSTTGSATNVEAAQSAQGTPHDGQPAGRISRTKR